MEEAKKRTGRKEADDVHPWKMARSLTALSTRLSGMGSVVFITLGI